MSRIGKKPIKVLDKTEVQISDSNVVVKGPLGQLSMDYLNTAVEIKQEGDEIIVTPKKDDIQTKALWGTYSSLISNMVEGVNKEYEKVLLIEGVGYRAEMKGNAISLKVGFSHNVDIEVPAGVKVEVEKERITVKGIDKQAVGEMAAVIRATKKPEPYKGKGIRYEDEQIRRKEGKKNV